MKSIFYQVSSASRLVHAAFACTIAITALHAIPTLAQTCTFATSPNKTKVAPIGLVAQGDTAWVQNSAKKANENALPQNDISVLSNYTAGTFKQIGIFAFWSDIMPYADSTPNFTSIDNALCALQNYNNTAHDHVTAKLRIVPDSRSVGDNGATLTASPGYALAVGDPGGNGILIQEYAGGGRTEAIGGFWIPAYTTYWKALNDALAKKYDNYNIISEVSVNTCASVDLEPWEQPRDPNNNGPQQSLLTLSPPYTDQQIINCLRTGPDAYSSWVHTPIVDVFSGYPCGGDNTAPNCGKSTKTEYVDTTQAMTNYLPLGAHLGYESNGLRPNTSTDGEQTFPNEQPGVNGGPPAQWALYGNNPSPVSMQPLDPNIPNIGPSSDLANAEVFGFAHCMTQLELNDQGQLGGNGATSRISQADASALANAFATRPKTDWNNRACSNYGSSY